MPWETVTARSLRTQRGLARVARSGNIQIAPEDFQAVGIDNICVLMVDRATVQIGVRVPAPTDRELRTVSAPKGRKSPVRVISAREAIAVLELDRVAVAGSYPIVIRDGMIVIQMPVKGGRR